MVNIYYTQLEKPLQDSLFKMYFQKLPAREKERNVRFVRWQDRHLHLFGKLLLLNALKNCGQQSNFESISYTANSKPVLENSNIFFNISHSGNYVMCALAENIKLGIDIEQIREIELSDFKSIFTLAEWELINSSRQPQHVFFDFWTRKECVIKADGRGLSIPLNEFEVIENDISYDKNNWFIKKIEISGLYASNIALSKKEVKINYKEINYYT